MTSDRLDVDILLFDVFGTLFDHDSALAEASAGLGEKADALASLWRQRQLEYSWLRTLMHRPADFRQVTEEGLDYALAALGLPGELKAPLMATYRRLAPYPEVADALAGLAATGRPLAILSNGSPAMLQAVVRAAGLEARFTARLSAAAAHVFKPHPLVYQLAVDHFGVPRERLCLVSANGWDAAGAAAFGMKAVWVNRKDAPLERLPTEPDAVISSLAELAPLLA
ncbi:MAG: haloacid dehalogenase type II [Alphaproteobacteria bacterium]|nr:MAG: haloacid dehalogenase type II [Alphaproteobacteria bacterium]